MGLSDTLLAGGVLPGLAAVHGETVLVLTGMDANKPFTAVIETENDVEIGADMGTNPRGRRMCRFFGTPPRVSSQDQIKTSDGRKWNLTADKFSAYLTTDFEMTEILSKG